jgi:hypothetical protein
MNDYLMTFFMIWYGRTTIEKVVVFFSPSFQLKNFEWHSKQTGEHPKGGFFYMILFSTRAFYLVLLLFLMVIIYALLMQSLTSATNLCIRFSSCAGYLISLTIAIWLWILDTFSKLT